MALQLMLESYYRQLIALSTLYMNLKYAKDIYPTWIENSVI